MSEKRYFWLKFDKDFMDKRIKKLRKIAGGDTYTIIYLKMILSSIETDGIIKYEGVENSLAEEIALDLDEDTDNVQVTVNFLMSQGLLVDVGNGDFALPYAQERIGSESASAKRVREYRERQKALQCNTDVTEQLRACNVEKRREEIEKDIDIYNNSLSNDKEYIESDVEPVITDSTPDAPVDSNLTQEDVLKVDGEEFHPKRDRIDYRGIQNDYNAICVSFPMCKLLSDKRKKEIKACVNNGITREDFRRAFEKAQESSFMKGNNNRGWQASFDWIIKLNNLVKILDGNYDNKQNTPTSPNFIPKSETKDELDNFYTEINKWANKGN